MTLAFLTFLIPGWTGLIEALYIPSIASTTSISVIMGAQQPFMYQPVENQNERLPYKAFDPKAVTRASMQPRPQKKKKQEGPLISFNRHPE